MAKIVTLGEIMLRLSTPGHSRFVQTDSFDVVYGGGEANVAVSCANYGHEAYFVTKLPAHEIGQSAVNSLRRFGVRTDFIARGGSRVGIYFLETGASMRASNVVYDRAHSSISTAEAADFAKNAKGNGMAADIDTYSGGEASHAAFIVEAMAEIDLAQSTHGIDPIDRAEEGQKMLVAAGMVVIDMQAKQAGADLAELLGLHQARGVSVFEVPANALSEVIGQSDQLVCR